MRPLLAIAVIGAGGAFGSIARYLVSTWFLQRFGPSFPWGTFTINVTGSFLIGIVLQLALPRAGFSPYLRVFLATGVLGGYTTFSTYAFEALTLTSESLYLRALLYTFGSVFAGVVAAYAGVVLARLVSPP